MCRRSSRTPRNQRLLDRRHISTPDTYPHAGDFFVFGGRRGDTVKILWHDGIGLSLYAKRLEHDRFIWPSPVDGAVSITAAPLGYLLAGFDRSNPRWMRRPRAVG